MFGLRAGASLPTGDVQDALETGFHLGVSVGFAPPAFPVGLRFDATLHQLQLSPHGGGAGHESENLRVISGTANSLYRLPLPFTPYVVGGLGMYNVRDPHVTGDENAFGWNLGAGIQFQLAEFNTFIELGYHQFDSGGGDVTLLPITVGVMF
jgi:opacity protein-like surface antigen